VTQAAQVTGVVCEHGEGPVWSAAWPGLRWVDMMAGDLLALAPDGSVTRRHLGTVLAALRPRASGGMVVALERKFALADEDGTVHPLGELWADPSVRMNDGGCDPDGRFYCGSMAYDCAPGRGRLYRLDPDGSTRVVLDRVTVSNGLVWSPDGATAYYVDSPTGRIDAFDYQLYITCSRLGLAPAAEAAAGALFRADVGVTGLPAATFAG
jgi:sugar lactone lactonase YvrE